MKRVITISREYGSGGRFIGRLAAEKLGFAFYDKDLIELAAKESGLAEDFIKDSDESLSLGAPFNFSIWDMFPIRFFRRIPCRCRIRYMCCSAISSTMSRDVKPV